MATALARAAGALARAAVAFHAVKLADILKTRGLDAPWITGVTDKKGIILARSERHDDFVGQPLPAAPRPPPCPGAGFFRTKGFRTSFSLNRRSPFRCRPPA